MKDVRFVRVKSFQRIKNTRVFEALLRIEPELSDRKDQGFAVNTKGDLQYRLKEQDTWGFFLSLQQPKSAFYLNR